MHDVDALKDNVCAQVDAMRETFVGLSARIHETPEVGLQERQAARWLTGLLREHGFAVTQPIAGMATAFRAATKGERARPHVALIAEYDALAGVGHACGHNLICMASVGAAVALHRAVPTLPGTLTVLGTPAEETTGGKIPMVEQGVFEGVDAAMMFHPSRNNWWVRGALAAQGLTITFHGKSSHAAAAPEKGVNALNALLLTYHAIDALRQHVTSDVRIHGIITKGGDAPKVVPALAQGEFIVRANTRAALVDVMAKVKGCAEGAAAATAPGWSLRRGSCTRSATTTPSSRATSATTWRGSASAARRRRSTAASGRPTSATSAWSRRLSIPTWRSRTTPRDIRRSFARRRGPSGGTPQCSMPPRGWP